MFHLVRRGLLLGMLALLASCAVAPTDRPDSTADRTPCQLVFDAGSSGTRLFVYEKRGGAWLEHAGPKTVALADPVRQIRGKVHGDLEAVTAEVVAQLDRVIQAGPNNSKGQPEWAAFDWQSRCTVTDAMVLATAGMRMAEQEHPAKSKELWTKLQRKLQARVGGSVRVAARTLTGFEEGLYAWLAVREGRGDNRFGIAEMGGASSQVTFPCPNCNPADDAVRTVFVKGQAVPIFSYSFLGLGQDEAPRTLNQPASCAYGIATKQADWKPSDCANRIDVASAWGLRDPYNFGRGHVRGTERSIPTATADVAGWILTGAFNFMSASAVATCCQAEGQCFEAASSCFRALYLEKYLEQLAISPASPRAEVSWTQGAVLCAESRCLRAVSPPLPCRWSATGCL